MCAAIGSQTLTGWIAPNETKEGAQTVITFDLSDSAFSGLTQAQIGLVDYADNQTVSDFYSLTGGETTETLPTSVELNTISRRSVSSCAIAADAFSALDSLSCRMAFSWLKS